MEIAQIIRYLQVHDGVSPEDVGAEFQVSTRTLRKYVARANVVLDGVATVNLVRGEGYHVISERPDELADWLARQDGDQARFACKTAEERVNYLLNDLLMRNDWIKLQDLSDVLYVSKSALSGDLKRVESRLHPYGLALEKRSHYGIRVTGDEMSRRLCMANAAIEAGASVAADTGTVKGDGLRVLKGLMGDAFEGDEKMLDTIATCVSEATKGCDVVINPVAFQNLLVHIVIALVRISNDCYMPIESGRLEIIAETNEYKAAENIAERIAVLTSIELPREEIAYIAIHLAGKQTIYQSSDEDSPIISDEVWRVVSDMLEHVWGVFRFDFRNDLELRMNLARHIQPLSVRLRYNMKLKNPMLEDIKARYPLSYAIAVDASAVIADTYGSTLSNDEIGYIALAFELALERSRTAIAKKRILVVCASGAGSARLLEYQCRREFGEYIDSIQTCDALSVNSIDFSTVDYVFTTVPLGRDLPVPVREVSCFLDPIEAEDARMMLRRNACIVPLDFSRYVDEHLFFAHLELADKEDVLAFLITKVQESRKVASNFRELVFARERCMATAFGNNIAMPHPLEAASDETFVCVGLLDRPIAWGDEGEKVQAVFLTGFSCDENGAARSFMDCFTDLLVDSNAVERLLSAQRWEVFVELLENASMLTHKSNVDGAVSR